MSGQPPTDVPAGDGLHGAPPHPAPAGTTTERPTLRAVPAEPAELPPAEGTPTYADVTGEGERKPVLPRWMRRGNLGPAVRRAAGRARHEVQFHGLRSPWYLACTLFWGVVGTVWLVVAWLQWWLMPVPVEAHTAAVGEGWRAWKSLHTEHKRTAKARAIISAIVLVAAIFGGEILWAAARWVFGPLALAAVLGAARWGRPEGVRIVGQAHVPAQYLTPTPEVITHALGSLGVSAISGAIKDGRGIAFVSDVHRDGPGWGCQLDLPHGVTAKQIIAKREELASGLRRPLSAVWPAEVPEVHTGRLDLWIGFTDLAKAKAPPWPLLRAGQADVFGTVPFGTDPRGRTVSVPLFEVNWLIGASPGQGKTAAVRVIGCATALDVLADLWVHELAGKGDLDLSRVCHRYCSGIDDEAVQYAAESARMLRKETERRAARFKKLKGTGVMPHGKVTRELAGRYRDLRPLIAIFDEVQNLFMAGDTGKQAAADLAFAIRVGRAMGITVVLATQRPNATSVPADVSGLIISRFCLMVPGQVENDMVLGTSSFRNGYKATTLRPKVDAGLGWLKGSEDGIPQVVKSYYLNLKATERIVDRARAMRERAGVLTGYALGEEDAGGAQDVLGDVLAAFGAEEKLQWEPLAARLAERYPDRWAAASAASVSAQLRDLGVPARQVKSAGRNLNGCWKADIEQVGVPA